MSDSPRPELIAAVVAALSLVVPGAPGHIVARAFVMALRRAGFEIVPSRDDRDCGCWPLNEGCASSGCPRAKQAMEASA